jgi:hypothetical protein
VSSKFRLIYCFFLVKSWVFFIEKVHILRITHFSETTKDRNLIFGMGGDANVKLCIQHFYPRGSAPPCWEICFKKCDRDPHPKPYIFMIRMTRQIKCLIAQALRGHTPPPIWNLFWLTLSYIPLFFQVCCQFVDKYLNVMYKNGHES